MSSTERASARAVPPSEALGVPPSGAADGGGAAVDVREVPLPGATLSVRRYRPGSDGLPPALYVHGLGGSSRNWESMAPLLAGRVDGQALDLPGFGASPPPDDGDYSLSGHARAVIHFLDADGRGPVHLLGNSMGGAVVTRVAALRPDLVRTLTLVSPALPERRPQRTAVPTAMLAIPGVAGLWQRMTRDWTPEQYCNGVLTLCYGDTARVTDEVYEAAVAEARRRQALPYHWDAMERSARGVVGAYTLGGQHALWRQAQRVLAPVLLVYGARDQLVHIRMARKASRAFRDSRLLVLPAAGHVAMMEYPQVVARAFGDLLDETAGAGDESRVGAENSGG